MKKVISVLLLVLLVSVFAGMAVSADAIQTYLKGDADGDETVSVIDATKIQRVLVDLDEDTDGMIAMRGDINGDGLDIVDATLIQRYLVDFDDGFNINTIIEYEAPTTAPTEPATQEMTSDPDELPFVPVSTVNNNN